ncbi:MAG TPA: glucoamylase family protein [Longimicrobiaceae bacterium]
MRYLTLLSLLLPLMGCANATTSPDRAPPAFDDFVPEVQERTFRWFWDTTNPENGLVPDRWPEPPFASIAAVGFGLSAYPVGVERGWITREEARERTLNTLRFFWNAPQGDAATGMTGYRGFFYHFIDMDQGLRYRDVELSTIDTALLMAGVLTVGEYFDQDDPVEEEIRALADSLYRRVEWDWFQREDGLIRMAWYPDRGFGPPVYTGYNEAMILYLLALGSPTHPVDARAWSAFTSSYEWADFYGQEHVNFAPLFGHQYSHIWVDFRGIRDAYMRSRGIDYFENSRRAALAQREYAIDNPNGWVGYDANVWGLTASDGPVGATIVIDGRERQFRTYWARGAAAGDIRDDGTIAPTAVGGSFPFVPELAAQALRTMAERYGEHLYREYGFIDAFNPTLRTEHPVTAGEIVPGVGWFDDQYLGIDQGPIVLMIENYRSELIWRLMRNNDYIVRGLCRAGFSGGWLEGRCTQ